MSFSIQQQKTINNINVFIKKLKIKKDLTGHIGPKYYLICAGGNEHGHVDELYNHLHNKNIFFVENYGDVDSDGKVITVSIKDFEMYCDKPTIFNFTDADKININLFQTKKKKLHFSC